MRKKNDLTVSNISDLVYESVIKAFNNNLSNNHVRNFNNCLDKSNKSLNESNINRMLHWLKDCDCAFISAFRSELKDIKNKHLTYFGPDKNW